MLSPGYSLLYLFLFFNIGGTLFNVTAGDEDDDAKEDVESEEQNIKDCVFLVRFLVAIEDCFTATELGARNERRKSTGFAVINIAGRIDKFRNFKADCPVNQLKECCFGDFFFSMGPDDVTVSQPLGAQILNFLIHV